MIETIKNKEVKKRMLKQAYEEETKKIFAKLLTTSHSDEEAATRALIELEDLDSRFGTLWILLEEN